MGLNFYWRNILQIFLEGNKKQNPPLFIFFFLNNQLSLYNFKEFLIQFWEHFVYVMEGIGDFLYF